MKLSQSWQRWRRLSIREQVAWTRRLLPVLIFFVVALIQVWLSFNHASDEGSGWVHLSIELFVYAVLGPVVTWFVLLWIERQLAEKERMAQRFRQQEQRMLQIADDVRAEIANDLHDSLGPSLYASALKAQVCRKLLRSDPCQVEQELKLINESLERSIREVRRAVYALRPLALERVGLYEALRKQATDFEEVNQLKTELVISGEERRLSSELEVGLFHIVQESLHNISRHAGASSVSVRLDVKPQIICLSISDDGQGFDVVQTQEGVGLRHMRERADALAGHFSIKSTPGQGAQIAVCLPVSGESGR